MDEVSGRHMLIMFRYDYRHLERFIQTRITTANRESWKEVAPQLARFGHSASLAPNSSQRAARMAAKTPEYLRHLRSVLADVKSYPVQVNFFS